MRERVDILGVGVDRLSAEVLHAEMLRIVHGGERAMFLYVNAHCLNLSYHHPWLRDLLNKAHIVKCQPRPPLRGDVRLFLWRFLAGRYSPRTAHHEE